MATPALAEGSRAIDVGETSYINLSNNVRPQTPAGDSIGRNPNIPASSSRRNRAQRATQQDVAEQQANADEAIITNPLSSTSADINEAVAPVALAVTEHAGNAATLPVRADDINSHRNLTPLMRIKLSELTTSSSDSEVERSANIDGAGGNDDGRRAASPPPNCAICLGRCKNKCFTDSCMHQFCFKCLCEWSKVKPECPLCKQTFKSIIHNVKSIHQFEEYHVQPPTVQIPHRPMEVTIRSLPYIFDAVVVEGHDWELPRRRNSGHRIRPSTSGIFYPSAISDAPANSGDNANSSSGGSVYNSLVYRNELLDMYRQEAPDAIEGSGTLSTLWRRFIYDRRLFALPVCDITGRFRESTARFYRDNPAQVHRLMPWINRDIVCLLRNTEHDVSSLLERINESLLQTNILSPAFRRRLQPYLGTKTSHFIHELNNFARSPYDMIGYDRAVHYLPQAPEEIVIEFSSSPSSDDENASASNSNERRTRSRSSRARNDNEFRVLSRSGNSSATTGSVGAMLSFTVSTTSEGTEAPGVTLSINGRNGQSAAINLSTHNRVSGDVIDLDDAEVVVQAGAAAAAAAATNTDAATTTATTTNTMAASTTTATTNTIADEAASTSAAANRPLPTVTENIELTSSSSDECEFVLERKPPHLRTPELVSLNSESDSDVVFVEEAKPLRKTAFESSDDETKDKAEAAKRKRKNETSAATATQVTTQENNKHETADREELYNVGASTSTGLRSSGGGGRGVKEIYERTRRSTASRQKRNLRNNRLSDEAQAKQTATAPIAAILRRGKRIYESSCTTSNFSTSDSSDTDDDEDFTVKRQRTKRPRNSRKKNASRSRRKTAQSNKSGSCSRSNTRASSRKRRHSSSTTTATRKTTRQRSQNSKRFKKGEMGSHSEYTSDDSQNLIELRRRLQELKEAKKKKRNVNLKRQNEMDDEYGGGGGGGGGLCDRGDSEESQLSSLPSNSNTNTREEEQMRFDCEHLELMQSGELGELQDLQAANDCGGNFECDRRAEHGGVPANANEEDLGVAQNVCVSSTNDDGERSATTHFLMEEDNDNTFSSTVTQTTTATTVTTTAANQRSLSRASATTNNTNYNEDNNDDIDNDMEIDNDNENDIEIEQRHNRHDRGEHDNAGGDEDNYHSAETSSTASSSAKTSLSSHSLFSASSGGEEEDGDGDGDGDGEGVVEVEEAANNRNNYNNDNIEGDDDHGNSLGLQQLLDTTSLGDAWLVHQLGNAEPNADEIGLSMLHQSSGGEANIESNEQRAVESLSPGRLAVEEAVSLPNIENDDVDAIFLNQHDTNIVMPFNYDAEGSQSEAE